MATSKRDREAYFQGLLDGITCFGWMKDGVTYVGTTGMTLKEAKALAKKGLLWNQLGPTEDLKLKEQDNADAPSSSGVNADS